MSEKCGPLLVRDSHDDVDAVVTVVVINWDLNNNSGSIRHSVVEIHMQRHTLKLTEI